MPPLESVLTEYSESFHHVIPYELQHGAAYLFNLTREQPDFASITPSNLAANIQRTEQLLKIHHADLGIGRYAELRNIYPSEQYQSRNLHLGIDLSIAVNTPIYTPLDGRVHSYNNNQQAGDYGPTLILEHSLNKIKFYTLYGHLSLASIEHCSEKQIVTKGQQIATAGDSNINGGWPTHLHFQIISDINGYHGDYPGVCSQQESEYFLANCPNPNLILNIAALKEQ